MKLKFGDSHSQIESYDVEHLATLVGPFSAAYLPTYAFSSAE